MITLQEIISDESVQNEFANTDFGSTSNRDVIRFSLLKCASGYSTGHTAKQILIRLGLVDGRNWSLTQKGKEYLFVAFYQGNSI